MKKFPLNAPKNRRNDCQFNFSAEKDFEALDELKGERVQIIYEDFEALMQRNRGKSFEWIRIFNGEVYRPAEKFLGDYHKTLVPGYVCVAVQRMKDLGWNVTNGDFLFHLLDGPHCTEEERERKKEDCKIPPLTHNSRKGRDFAVQIPWLPYIAIDQDAHREIMEFKNKQFIAEWRGRLTGLGTEPFVGSERDMSFSDFPRARLVLASMENNNTRTLDARFIGFPDKNHQFLDPEVHHVFEQLPGHWKKGSRLTRREQSTYAFHVVVDGDFGQARLPYQLIMNSVVFRKKTNWTDHYEHRMRDGIDYVLYTTEDELISKIHNLQNNPEEAERIARNGRLFAKTCLTSDNFLLRFQSVLSLYSERLAYKIEDGGGVEQLEIGKKSVNVPNFGAGW